MGIKIPKTNNFVIDDVLNIVLKKRKKEEKKSKKEPKLNKASDEESKNKSDIVESNKAKVKQAFMEVEKIIVGTVED